MATQKANSNLHKAKNAKKDEFYTQLLDIENELKHYHHHFKTKWCIAMAGKQNSVTDKCSAKNVTEVKEGNKYKYILLEYKDIMTMVENYNLF